MNIGQAIISGMVQGLTEFFPISSSGHLVMLHALFELKEPQLTFDIALHLGTLMAVTVYFWDDIVNLFTKRRRDILFIILGTLPVAVIGLTLRNTIEALFGMPRLVCAALLITAVWLFSAHVARNYYKKRHEHERPLNAWRSLLIGFAQAVAIIPGISRSGATISTGMLLGVSGKESFRFACLLSIPAIAGASLLRLPKAALHFHPHDALIFFTGTATAAIVCYATLKILERIIRNNEFYFFAIYCAAAALAGFFIF